MSCELCPHCRAEAARSDALANLAAAIAGLVAARTPEEDEEVFYEEAGDFTIPRRKRPWDRPDYGTDGKLTGVVDFLDGHQAAELGEGPRCPEQIIDRAQWRKGWRQGREEAQALEERQREWADKVELYDRRRTAKA